MTADMLLGRVLQDVFPNTSSLQHALYVMACPDEKPGDEATGRVKLHSYEAVLAAASTDSIVNAPSPPPRAAG